MNTTRIFPVILTTTLLASPALAQIKVIWSCNIMAAQPAGAPIDADLHDSLAGAVRFKEGKTGNIALICPIADDLDGEQLRTLVLTYRDGDYKVSNSSVTAAIRRVRAKDGHVETLRNGNVSSNDKRATNSGPDGWATHQSSTEAGEVIGHILDLRAFYYYVQINLKRTSAGVPVAAMGVHLTN
jgi:hypothetical protein